VNVLNIDDIERELLRVASHATHPAAKEWVLTVARNYILSKLEAKDVTSNFRLYTPNKPGLDMPAASSLPVWAVQAIRRKESLYWFDPVQVRRRQLWQALEFIVNWFNGWTPTDTRLRRLSRINFGTAATAAGIWMSKISTNLWDYIKDKPPVIRSYEDGFYWVRLITNLHFERESRLMKNCIGNGNYYTMFKRGDAEFYSLRDKHNNPHVSIEVRVTPHGGRSVQQCKGNSNAKAAPQYQRFCRRFFEEMKWDISGDRGYID
jgi:hypothetical protein